jgi:hypothetical protein
MILILFSKDDIFLLKVLLNVASKMGRHREEGDF